MSHITTFTRKHFDPVDPDPDRIDIRDIAHALSLTCRGNGHVKTFYSVGQHCISCAREAIARGYDTRMALICLLHDASEAYMSDVPRPFKGYLQVYNELEDKLLSVIYRRFLGSEISEAEYRTMKQIDDDLLMFDLKELFDDFEGEVMPVLTARHDHSVRPFEEVEQEYLQMFSALDQSQTFPNA